MPGFFAAAPVALPVIKAVGVAALTAGEAIGVAAGTVGTLVVGSAVMGGRAKSQEDAEITRILSTRTPDIALVRHYRQKHGLSKKQAVKKAKKVLKDNVDNIRKRLDANAS